MSASERVRVVLAGNPNCGKTSLFNALTGAHQHVGNYPGVTVERREGTYAHGGVTYSLLDLPGTYSLACFSPEERVAQDEILDGRPDVTVVVADSTVLKRSLVILVQIMEIGANPVLCLNMADEAARSGQTLDVPLLAKLLGFPVVETAGHKGEGVAALKDAIARAAASPVRESRLVLGERLDTALLAIGQHLGAVGIEPSRRRWVAGKLLQADPAYVDALVTKGTAGARAIEAAAHEARQIEQETRLDPSLFIAERRYGFVDGLLREVVRTQPRADARAVSDRIDAVLVNRLIGLPVFLLVMYAIFWLTFRLGEYPMTWIEAGFGALGEWIDGFWAADSDSALRSLVVDGIIGGVGGVIVFLPNIVLLFLGLAFLEDTGYMARAAFLMDRFMHRFGLHGKSFIPLMTGFGCSIPGIMATRTLENDRDRLTTMLVLPLVSCSARLPIWLLLVPAFFPPAWQAPTFWAIYTVGILLALVLALVLRRSVFRGEEAPFVMELPPYRLPTLRAVWLKMGERAWLYLHKAGTVILGISILMWVLTAYPKPDGFAVDRAIANGDVRVVADPDEADGVTRLTSGDIDSRRAAEALRHSAAGRIAAAIEPVFRPLGFDVRLVTAMLGAFAAKEVFVSQLGIVYALGSAEDTDTEALRERIRLDYTPLQGVSIILFMLIATPCMATLAVTRRESGRWRWALVQFFGLTIIAYLLSLVVYQVGLAVS